MIFESFITTIIAGEGTMRMSNGYYSEKLISDFMQIMHMITVITIVSTRISPSSSRTIQLLSNLTAATESLKFLCSLQPHLR